VIGRRDILRAVTAVGVAATTVAVLPTTPAAAADQDDRNKHRAQYQANSAEVQTFYRVNRYPQK
jgi:hypothetical protein